MTNTNPCEASASAEALKKARLRWQAAQAALAKHTLLSDPALDVKLLENARRLPTWRGPIALLASWLLPQAPSWSETPTPAAQAGFVGLGALALFAAVWWLLVDGLRWMRWIKARRAIGARAHGYRHLASLAGLPADHNLSVLDRSDPYWRQLGQWCERCDQLAHVWQKWNQGNPPVRKGDAEVLEEAVLAWVGLRTLNGKSEPALSEAFPTTNAADGISDRMAP